MNSKINRMFTKILHYDFVFANFLAVVDRYRGVTANITGFVKVFMIVELLFVLYYLYTKKFKLQVVNPITYFIGYALFAGIFVGVINQHINTKFISHLYEYIMPLFTVSVGYKLFDDLRGDEEAKEELKKAVKAGAITYILGVLLFRVMYALNLANYNAYGSGTIDFVLPFLLFLTDKTFLPFALIVAGVLSGKRSILVKVAVIFIFYLFNSKRDKRKLIKEFILILIGIGVFIYVARNTVFFNRIILTINNMIGEEKNLDLATGGRTSEYKLVVAMMGENILKWIFGNGFGTFIVTAEGIVRHYSHLTPLAYIMSSGLLFMGALYSYMLYLFMRLKRHCGEVHKTMACYILMIFVGSFFGATLLNEPKMWLLIGISARVVVGIYEDEGEELRS